MWLGYLEKGTKYIPSLARRNVDYEELIPPPSKVS